MNKIMLEAGKGKFESFEVKTNRNGVQAYGVRCGKKSFIYLYNSGSAAENIQISGIPESKTKGKMSWMDGETGKYSTVKFVELPDKSLKMEQIQLPAKGNAILIQD